MRSGGAGPNAVFACGPAVATYHRGTPAQPTVRKQDQTMTEHQPQAIDETLLAEVEAIAERAGEVILGFYEGPVEARAKADASPVTAADEAAEAVILPALAPLLPGVPIVSEEAVAAGQIPEVHGPGNSGGRFWLVDPLDGTKEFLSRNGEFTVNIALVENGQPVLGVVHIPALGTTYGGLVPGLARKRHKGTSQPIRVRTPPRGGSIVLSSRSHGDSDALDAFLAGERVGGRRIAGSALKFCLVAEGIADIYPRLGRTMEWDTAAGHAIVAAAGGRVTMVDGGELVYGKPGFDNPHFVARGRMS
jgi:3'(2'), 5'-bisphosphate nucleotidase